MDELSTKAIIIGISVFVTLTIITVIIFEFTTIKELYKGVAETDVSFESKFNELNKYKEGNNLFSGIDLKNTVNKYKDNDLVEVCIDTGSGNLDCSKNIDEPIINYGSKYKSLLKEIGMKYQIVFRLVYTGE